MYCPFFDAGYTKRHRDHNRGLKQADATGNFVKKVTQHHLSNFIVSNDSITQRTNDLNILIIDFTQHFTRGLSDFHNTFIFGGQRD